MKKNSKQKRDFKYQGKKDKKKNVDSDKYQGLNTINQLFTALVLRR